MHDMIVYLAAYAADAEWAAEIERTYTLGYMSHEEFVDEMGDLVVARNKG